MGGAPYLLIDGMAPDSGGLPAFVVQRPADVQPANEVPALDADLQAVCLLTSGSTGAPQPHAKRWGALVANIGAEAERLAAKGSVPLGAPSAAKVSFSTLASACFRSRSQCSFSISPRS